MAKTKGKKRGLSDSVRGKKKGTEKINPFEVKINRQKHNVIGQKLSKFDKGRPGVSRSRAIQKRKETLLVEYKKRGKANTFVDRRIGENDPQMSIEEKMLQRYAAERQKTNKRSIYNLNEEDEEELTHYGQSLSQIEKFDAPVASDDEDADADGNKSAGKLDSKMVSDEFFGGGILSKKDEEEEGKHRTWKERMEEIIARSKQHKYERQHEREQVTIMTERVDQDWKQLMKVMSSSFKAPAEETATVKQYDDFDRMVRELHFEVRGTPSDRMKTEEEIAKEEKEKLEKLEADRVRRMKGLSSEEEAAQIRAYRSADSLDDDLYAEPEKPFIAFYKDGKLVTADEQEAGADDQSEDENESEADGSGEGEGSEEEEGVEGEEEDEKEGNSEESGSEDEEDDVMAHLSDLDESESEEDSEADDRNNEENEDSENREVRKSKTDQSTQDVSSKETNKKPAKSVQFNLKDRDQQIEEAKKELPYVFEAPSTYEALESLLRPYSELEQLICVERLRKCNHPSLAEGNKQKMENLFGFLVQYYCQCAVQKPVSYFWLMDRLVAHLYQLSNMSPDTAAQAMLRVVLEKQAEYSEVCQRRNGKGVYPQLDVLLLFKLVSLLYPTSDFHHPVVTPTMLFMSQILTQSSVSTNRDVASGLLLCTIFLEYVTFSKRFVPEMLNFLNGVLFLGCEKQPGKLEPVIPPFKPVGKNLDLLVIRESKPELEVSERLRLGDIYVPSRALKYLASDQYWLDALYAALRLLRRCGVLYESLPAHREIFSSTSHFLKLLPVQRYPQVLQDEVSGLLSSVLSAAEKPLKWLKWEKKTTKALKLYEPKVEEDFDPSYKKAAAPSQDHKLDFDPSRKKKAAPSREKDEKQRLMSKYRKEMKGALREIRRDAQFLAKQRLQEQIERDNDRKRKVKELLGDLSTQQGDLNALKRMKNKM